MSLNLIFPRWYPFDTQVCTIKFQTSKDLNIFVNLITDSHSYRGPVELTQYFVRRTDLFMKKNSDGNDVVVFELALGRRLTAVTLTAFMPTILLNIIGHGTNFFKDFFFEAVVTVNLTVMFVLTTMFISIRFEVYIIRLHCFQNKHYYLFNHEKLNECHSFSSSLPVTSYDD